MNVSKPKKRLAAIFAGLFCLSLAASSRGQVFENIAGFLPTHAEAERALEREFRLIPDAGHAESDLRYLTSRPHMAGTEASHQIAEWLRDQYQSYGFDAQIVSYTAWLPEPRDVELELVKPQTRALATPEAPYDGDPDTYDPRAVRAFNTYSPSGEVTAPVVYVNFGTPDDYRELAALGVSVEGKVVLARYGEGYRGVKARLAEQHKAAALILYSDPEEDGYAAGTPYPQGPWRPMSSIQRGSILYTEIYPGDPLTPEVASVPGAQRLAPADAANLPRIPTMPISANDAAVILRSLRGKRVPRGWQGGLPFTYRVGGSSGTQVHMKIVMDYAERPLYDVIAKLHGTSDDQWVILGNHHDAWVFGAADPGSGTAAMLETARALGTLARSGWKPRRTIVMCHWDGEEPGLLGSTEWVEQNRAELQAKAVAYINADVGVAGPDFAASATPSLKDLVRDATREVADPDSGASVYDAWVNSTESPTHRLSEAGRQSANPQWAPKPPVGDLGAGSDFSPFFDYAGIASIDMGFGGDYGVYHSIYDDFYWMKHFGDPTFAYHVALARILGTIALRLDEADILPFDYSNYASAVARNLADLQNRAMHQPEAAAILKPVGQASAQFTASAARAEDALRAISAAPSDPATEEKIDRELPQVEQALLAPDGLTGRPWFKHTIFAPGAYAGYSSQAMPGISQALDDSDMATLRREADSLSAALLRASARLDEIAHLARSTPTPWLEGH